MRRCWAVVLLLHTPAATGLAVGTALAKSLKSTAQPLVVHVWDRNPSDLKSFAIDEVSYACRDAGASAVLVESALLGAAPCHMRMSLVHGVGWAISCALGVAGAVVEEQEVHRGSFPGPLPVIADCALKEMTTDSGAVAEFKCAIQLRRRASGPCSVHKQYCGKP